METLASMIPDVEVLLALAPEELAPALLKLAKLQSPNGKFHPGNMTTHITGQGMAATADHVYAQRSTEVDLACQEAWQWATIQGLIMPAPGTNGHGGWMVFSRRGRALVTDQDFESFRQAAAFPKALLHPAIADKVWLALARGDLDDAVFHAFKKVEETVRRAGGYDSADIGPKLMRKAFDKDTGPLTDQSQPEAEREALAHLFAGAIGSYKNPHSHRTVSLSDPRDAQEMTVLASHLLRIVDARSRKST